MKNGEGRGGGTGYMSVAEVAEFLSVSPRTVWRLTAEGILPKPIVLGKQIRRWNLAEVETCVAGLAGKR